MRTSWQTRTWRIIRIDLDTGKVDFNVTVDSSQATPAEVLAERVEMRARENGGVARRYPTGPDHLYIVVLASGFMVGQQVAFKLLPPSHYEVVCVSDAPAREAVAA